GRAAGGDDHAEPRFEHLAVDRDLPRTGEPPATPDEPATFTGEPLDCGLVVPVGCRLIADPGRDLPPVGRDVGPAGQPVDASDAGDQVGRADHHFRRDASPVRAFPADEPVLHPHHGEPRFGEPPAHFLASDAHTQDNDVNLTHALTISEAGWSRRVDPSRSGYSCKGGSDRGGPMTEHLETRLEIKSWDEQPYRELDQTGKFTRADVELSASAGGLEAEAFFESLMCYPGDGTASFVSLMHIAGRIGDRAGSFALQGSGTYDGTTARSELTVIPNSGTGE